MTLWHGTWTTRARIASGLILFAYAFLHFLNIGAGLFSPVAMETMQEARQTFTRSVLGTFLLYGGLLIHGGLALLSLAGRGTLRMPAREAVQMALGLIIPFLLFTHIVFTRGAHETFGVNDDYGYLIGLIWGSTSAWTQNALLLIVWIHGCIGLHVWLRGKRWWQSGQPWLLGSAVLVPAFSIAGFIAEGRRVSALFANPESADALYEAYNWPDNSAFQALIEQNDSIMTTITILLAMSVAVYLVRRVMRRRQSVSITFREGPSITAPKGLTLLEMSRTAGVPHTSLCGGKGRCTTCRVIVDTGADTLEPPSSAETAALAAVGASDNSRLACQIRPTRDLAVFRVFQPGGQRRRSHESTGEERPMAILFLDMRGFTSRTAGQLPYDVVFLLNRFFDAIVPAINNAGGTVDKYLGDGLLAIFETADAASSARAALDAAQGIGRALADFNDNLVREGEAEVRIGVGLHLGDVVLGEIGAGRAPRTIIGDAVNTASRLEAKTKELGVPALVTKTLLERAGISVPEDQFTSLTLRGVEQPVDALPISDLTVAPAGVWAGDTADATPV